MKITLSQLLALAATANCAAFSLEARDTPLDVQLTSLGNSKVKAVVTNKGDSSYNLFYKGTFLDTAPVDKFHVSTAGKSSFSATN